MDQTDGRMPRQDAEGEKMEITLCAETGALQEFLKELETDLAAAPQEVRKLALDLLDLATELADIQSCPASGAGVAILLKPSQWLLDFAAAVRAGDLNWLGVEYSHKRLSPGGCETCSGAREIRRPYSAVERIPCPACAPVGGSSGLLYRHEDGVETPLDGDVIWTLHRGRKTGSWYLNRYMNGLLEDSWAPQSDDTIGIALAAIIRGYQPPPVLRRLETRSGRIQPDSEPVSAV